MPLDCNSTGEEVINEVNRQETLYRANAWRSTWEYQRGDLISYNLRLYLAMQDNVNVSPDSDPNIWRSSIVEEKGGLGWSTSISYAAATIVSYQNKLYIALVDNVGLVPPDNPASWLDIAGEYLPITGGTITGDLEVNGELTTAGNRVLTTADEGSGNGLDADTLDGQHASHFATTTDLDTKVNKSGDTMTGNLNMQDNRVVFTYPDDAVYFDLYTGPSGLVFRKILLDGSYHYPFFIQRDDTVIPQLKGDSSGWSIDNNTVWHAGNMGSGSGLDADLLDGLHSTDFASASGLQDHLDDLDNPHKVVKSDVDLGNVPNLDTTDAVNHVGLTDNPHQVTKDQILLGNVDNTSDLDKPISTATQAALDLKADQADLDANYFTINDHVSSSSGTGSAGLPIVLNDDGQVDVTMLGDGTYPVGLFTPVDGAEYPDTSSERPGAYWLVIGVDDTNGYTFTGGDLAGMTVYNGNAMLLGQVEWILIPITLLPTDYYRLDGSQALEADFAGGGYKISNIADGTADTDGATVGQVNATFVKKSGDTMTGDLTVSKSDVIIETRDSDQSSLYFKDPVTGYNIAQIRCHALSEGFDYIEIVRRNDDGSPSSGIKVHIGGNVSSTAAAPTDDAHLTRKDYVDDTFVKKAGDTMTGLLNTTKIRLRDGYPYLDYIDTDGNTTNAYIRTVANGDTYGIQIRDVDTDDLLSSPFAVDLANGTVMSQLKLDANGMHYSDPFTLTAPLTVDSNDIFLDMQDGYHRNIYFRDKVSGQNVAHIRGFSESHETAGVLEFMARNADGTPSRSVRILRSGNVQTDTAPTETDHLTNKAYVDNNFLDTSSEAYTRGLLYRRGLVLDEDLNTIHEAGIYVQTNSTNICDTCNYPEKIAGVLVVENTGAYTFQTYKSYGSGTNNSDNEIWVRKYWSSDDNWSSWAQLVTTEGGYLEGDLSVMSLEARGNTEARKYFYQRNYDGTDDAMQSYFRNGTWFLIAVDADDNTEALTIDVTGLVSVTEDPTADNHLTRKAYVDANFVQQDYVDNNFLGLTGGTLTGNLTVGDGTNGNTINIRATTANPVLYYKSADSTNRVAAFFSVSDETYKIDVRDDTGATTSTFGIRSSNGNAYITAAQPIENADLTRKDYVDGRVVRLTQAEYDAITPDESVLYCIVG